MMPGLDGSKVCRRLKAEAATAEIAVIFLSALSDKASESRGSRRCSDGAHYL